MSGTRTTPPPTLRLLVRSCPLRPRRRLRQGEGLEAGPGHGQPMSYYTSPPQGQPARCRLAAQRWRPSPAAALLPPIGGERGAGLSKPRGRVGGGAWRRDSLRRRDWRRHYPISTGERAWGCARLGGNRGAAGKETPRSGRHVPGSGERGQPGELQVRCERWGGRGGRRVTSQSLGLRVRVGKMDAHAGCALQGLGGGPECASRVSRRAGKTPAEWSAASGRPVPGVPARRCARTRGECGAASWSRGSCLAPAWTGFGARSPVWSSPQIPQPCSQSVPSPHSTAGGPGRARP